MYILIHSLYAYVFMNQIYTTGYYPSPQEFKRPYMYTYIRIYGLGGLYNKNTPDKSSHVEIVNDSQVHSKERNDSTQISNSYE